MVGDDDWMGGVAVELTRCHVIRSGQEVGGAMSQRELPVVEGRGGARTPPPALSYQMSMKHNIYVDARWTSEQQPCLEKQRSVMSYLPVLQLQSHTHVAPD